MEVAYFTLSNYVSIKTDYGEPKAIQPSPPSNTKLLPPPPPPTALLIGYVQKRKLQLGF